MSTLHQSALAVPEANTSASADEGPSVPDLEDRNAAVNGESDELLAELESSQQAVRDLLLQQRQETSELGSLKEHLAAELLQLEDEAWRREVYAELEVLKRQMGELNDLEANIDRAEGLLDEYEEGAAASTAAAAGGTPSATSEADGLVSRHLRMAGSAPAAATANTDASVSQPGTSSAREGQGVSGEDVTELSGEDEVAADSEDEDVTVEEYEALQSQLDAELEAMYAKLQLVKAEAAAVATRKAELELELLTLLQAEAAELRESMDDTDIDPAVEVQLNHVAVPNEEASEADKF